MTAGLLVFLPHAGGRISRVGPCSERLQSWAHTALTSITNHPYGPISVINSGMGPHKSAIPSLMAAGGGSSRACHTLCHRCMCRRCMCAGVLLLLSTVLCRRRGMLPSVLTVIHRNTHWYVPLVSCFCALRGAIDGGWVCGEGDCIGDVTVGTGGA
jgi:hypothetical protein